jgi:hypothetical protein
MHPDTRPIISAPRFQCPIPPSRAANAAAVLKLVVALASWPLFRIGFLSFPRSEICKSLIVALGPMPTSRCRESQIVAAEAQTGGARALHCRFASVSRGLFGWVCVLPVSIDGNGKWTSHAMSKLGSCQTRPAARDSFLSGPAAAGSDPSVGRRPRLSRSGVTTPTPRFLASSHNIRQAELSQPS